MTEEIPLIELIMLDPEKCINKLREHIYQELDPKEQRKVKDTIGLDLAFDWVANDLFKAEVLRLVDANGNSVSKDELRDRLAYIAYTCVCLDITLKTYVRRLGKIQHKPTVSKNLI